MRVVLPLVLGLALLGAGCFGAPWVVPPARVTVGGGKLLQGKSATEGGRRGDGLVQVRISGEPLQLVPEAMDRPVDVGVGYLHESGPTGFVSGPFGELGWMLYAGATSRTSSPRGWGTLRPLESADACTADAGCVRVTARTRLASLRSGDASGGWQLGLQLAVELTGFATGAFGGGSGGRGGAAAAGGVAHGEGGIGLYVDGAQSRLAGDRWWSLSGGLVIRLPLSVGGFFVACPECVAIAFRN